MVVYTACACPRCEYDVSGVVELRCPECGHDLRGWASPADRPTIGGSLRLYDVVAGCVVLVYANIALGVIAFFAIAAAGYLHVLMALLAFVGYLVAVGLIGDRYGKAVCNSNCVRYTHTRRLKWILAAYVPVLFVFAGLIALTL